MNNPMEYFRMGAEKKKAEALKNNSLYNLENGNGEDLSPKDFERLYNKARRVGNNPIVKSRIRKGKATPRYDRITNEYVQAINRNLDEIRKNAMPGRHYPFLEKDPERPLF